MAPAARRILAAPLELRLRRLGGRHSPHVAELADQQLFGAAPVPVMVFGAAEAEDVLDDDVLAADLDLTVTGRAAVELARDAADQPGLIALFGDAAQAPAFVRQPREVGHGLLPR